MINIMTFETPKILGCLKSHQSSRALTRDLVLCMHDWIPAQACLLRQLADSAKAGQE